MAQGSAISRDDVMRRAKYWANEDVPYNQSGYYPDQQGKRYRTDCSGYVSMAWKLPESKTTRSLSTVAKRIRKDQLEKGDILLYPDYHVLIFEYWVDGDKTKYKAYEHTRQGIKHRDVLYPKAHTYEPYRYNNIKS